MRLRIWPHSGLLYLGVLIPFSIWCAEGPQKPVGFLIESQDEPDEEGVVKLLRDGVESEAGEGQEVLPGDVITTDEKGTIAVVFMDNCVVTLRERSRFKIEQYAYPDKKAATYVTMEEGRAYFSIESRPDDAHFFVNTRLGKVEVKGTAFEVYSVPNEERTSYTTSVGVTKGTVTLRPNGLNAVDILDGTQVVMTLNTTNVAGFPGAEIQLTQGNIDKDSLKLLKALAVESAKVNVGKGGKVTIKSLLTLPDGTVTTGRVTEINGVRTNQKFTMKDGKTTVMTLSIAKDKATVGRLFQGFKIKMVMRATGAGLSRAVTFTGTGTITDPKTKIKYKGTATYMPDGSILFQGTDKLGGKIFYHYTRDQEIVVVFPPGQTVGNLTQVTTSTTGTKTLFSGTASVDFNTNVVTVITSVIQQTILPVLGVPPPSIETPGGDFDITPASGG